MVKAIEIDRPKFLKMGFKHLLSSNVEITGADAWPQGRFDTVIETRIAGTMTANARQEYAHEFLDPASAPYDRFDMSGRRIVVLSTMSDMLLAVVSIRLVTPLRCALAVLRDILNIPTSDFAGESR